MHTRPVAIVSGANRGIGLEVVRQLANLGYTVVLGSRDLEKGQAAARGLEHVVAHQLEITDDASVSALLETVTREFGRLDALVNNAGALYDDWQSIEEADLETALHAFQINALGAWRMTQVFAPLLKRAPHPRVVNVSSEAGSLSSMNGAPAYSVSKAALNAVTVLWARKLKRDRVLVNAVCPGWVATDMGGSGGRPVRDGAASVVWGVTLHDSGPSGGFYRDGKPLPW
jgi:NAD(P)-dependent dehydrogenase (short-subunit alcohol dehydrogenase family)